MKKVFCIIGLILSVEAYGQYGLCFLSQTDSLITVYELEDGETAFAVISQDTITENYYSVEIQNSSKERYFVRIMSASSSSKASLEGWVKKDQCHVWLWPIEQENTIIIYEEPAHSSHCFKVDITEFNDIPAPVLDISKDGWYYVSLKHGHNSFSGWTKNVCTNIYGSCEHGNPYIMNSYQQQD